MEQGGASGRRYKHTIVEIKMSIVERPVRERSTSEQGRALVQSGECFKYKGIRGGGGFNVAGECEVKGADDHGFRQDGSISVVTRGVKVIPPGESISGPHVSPRGDLPDEIKVLKMLRFLFPPLLSHPRRSSLNSQDSSTPYRPSLILAPASS